MHAWPLTGHDCGPHEGGCVRSTSHATIPVMAAGLLDSATWDLSQHVVPQVGFEEFNSHVKELRRVVRVKIFIIGL